MLKFLFAGVLAFVAQAALAEMQCSYVVTIPCVWDYAPGYLTMNGVEYNCPNSTDRYVDQTCSQQAPSEGKTFRALLDAKHTQVIVYTDPNDVQGTLVCKGPATEDWGRGCN